ncbi:shikimate dehydrogenase [Chloroflexota bacterium]
MEMKLISGKTKICGVIGDPIEHTMSPVVHNAAFRELDIDYLYVPFRVKPDELDKAVEGVRALNIRGINVTIPHKVAIIPFLDKLDPLAEKMGAINTIVNEDGVLTGYNTDATGFLQALLERGIEPKGKNMVILGAGGASRAISFIVTERGANLVILNRHLARAEDLAHRISQVFKKGVKALALNVENLAPVMEEADILVNTTNVGMNPNVNETLVPARLFSPNMVVFDVVYNPIKTRFLGEAEEAGARTINGLDMLVWQGALTFEKWTGQKAPLDIMKKEVARALEIRALEREKK